MPSYPENVDEPTIYANSFSGNYFMFFSAEALPGNPRQLNMDMTLDFMRTTSSRAWPRWQAYPRWPSGAGKSARSRYWWTPPGWPSAACR